MKTKVKRKIAKRPVKRRAAAKREQRSLHDKRFPNESIAHRAARNRLLSAEMQLRDHAEAVAQLRRELTLVGELATD